MRDILGSAFAAVAGAVLIGSMATAGGPGQDTSSPLPKGRSSPFTVQTPLEDPDDCTASHISVTWGPCATDPTGAALGQIRISGVANGKNIVKARQAGFLRAPAIVPGFDLSPVSVLFLVTLDDGTIVDVKLDVGFYDGTGEPGVLAPAGSVSDGRITRPLHVVSESSPK